MIKREVRKIGWKGEQEVFTNQKTGDEYRRIVGAWPGPMARRRVTPWRWLRR